MASNRNSEKLLLDSTEIDEGIKVMEEMRLKIEKLLGVREVTLRNLHTLKKDIEESYDKSRKARIVGTIATVAGSILNIAGLALIPVTFSASLVLNIAGGTIMAAGGTTIAGADIGYYAVSKGKLDDANSACFNDREQMKELKQLGENFEKLLGSLAEKYETTEKNVFESLKQTSREVYNTTKPVINGIYSPYKLVDGVFSAGRVIATTSTHAGQAMGPTMIAGLGVAARVMGVASVVFDVVLIPMNLAVMIKASYDVHMYYKNGTSNSNRATTVQGLISDLKTHQDGLICARDDLNLKNKLDNE